MGLALLITFIFVVFVWLVFFQFKWLKFNMPVPLAGSHR